MWGPFCTAYAPKSSKKNKSKNSNEKNNCKKDKK